MILKEYLLLELPCIDYITYYLVTSYLEYRELYYLVTIYH